MKNYFKLFLSFFFITLFFYGCKSKTGESIDTSGKIKITFMNEGTTGEQRKIMQRQLDKFRKENPDIILKETEVPPSGQDTLLVMIAGGNAPDIFFINRVSIPEYIYRGALLDLTEYIKNSKVIKLEDIYPATMLPYMFDGKVFGKGAIYGFPKDFSPDQMLFYNKDLFDKAGIPYPPNDRSWTWEEFVTACKKLTIKDNYGRTVQYGTYLNVSSFPLFIYSNEGKMFSDDLMTCTFDNQKCVEAIRLVTDVALKHKACPEIQVTREADSSVMFRTEKVAMVFLGRWSIPDFYEQLKFRWGVAPAPHIKKRVNVMFGPNGYAIYKGTKHPDAAWKLMEFLISKEHQGVMGRLGWNIPSNKEAAESEDFLLNPDHPAGINKIFIDEVKYTIPVPSNPYINFWRVLQELERETDLYYMGKQTLEVSLANATKKINTIIQDGIKKDKK